MNLTGGEDENKESGLGQGLENENIDTMGLTEQDFFTNMTRRQRRTHFAIWITLIVLNVLALISWIVVLLAEEVTASEITNARIGILAGLSLLTFIMIIASWFGVYTGFRYNGTKNIIDFIGQSLENEATGLSGQEQDLKFQVDLFRKAVDFAKEKKNDLANVVKIGKEITQKTEEIKVDDENLKEFLNNISILQSAIRLKQRQILKANLIEMYFRMAWKDAKDGLSQDEYQKLLDLLDEDTKRAFVTMTTFERIDRNRDGVISIKEFQNALDPIIDELDKIDLAKLDENNANM